MFFYIFISFILFVLLIFIYNYKIFNELNDKTNKNSVIGLIRGYKEEILAPFLATLRNTSPKTSIVAFTDNITCLILQKYIKPSLLHIIILTEEYPYYPLNHKPFFVKEEDLKKFIPIYMDKSYIYFWNT